MPKAASLQKQIPKILAKVAITIGLETNSINKKENILLASTIKNVIAIFKNCIRVIQYGNKKRTGAYQLKLHNSITPVSLCPNNLYDVLCFSCYEMIIT